MFTLLRVLPAQRLVVEQLPSMSLAWLATEAFFKFHSFTLELFAFLAVWGVVDAAIQVFSRLIRQFQSVSKEELR